LLHRTNSLRKRGEFIAVACVLRFMVEAHSHLFTREAYPALSAHSAMCEVLPAIKEIVQPLSPPKR
jgi:glutathione S-transferase